MITHIVQPGETLFSIASRYGVSVQAIMQANGITNPNMVFVGQRLRIPVGGGTLPPPFPPTFPPGNIEQRLNRLEQSQRRTEAEVERLERRVTRLEQRVNRLEQR